MIGGRLVVFGGGSSTGTDLVQSFDLGKGTGRVVGHLPVPLSDLVAASIGSTTVGYPNGDTPLPGGHLLISELNGGWVDEVTPKGRVLWARQLPGLVEPSDPQLSADGTYMVASYAHPGAVIRFDRSGKVLWYYHPTSGRGELDHPSLAVPLLNGLVA